MSILQSIKNTVARGGQNFSYTFNQGAIAGIACNFELSFNQVIEIPTQTQNVIGAEGVYADYKLAGATYYDVKIVLGVSTDKKSSVNSVALFNYALKEIQDILKPKIIDNSIQGQFIFSHPVFGENIITCVKGDIITESPGIGGTISFRLYEILNEITQRNLDDSQRIQKGTAVQKKNNIFDKIKNTISTGISYANATTNEINKATDFFNTFANTLTEYSTQLSNLQLNALALTQNYSNFLSAIQTFKGNISQFTQTPSLLAENLSSIYDESSKVFLNSDANGDFVISSLNDNVLHPFLSAIPQTSTDELELERYFILDFAYKSNLVCNFAVALYDYQFNSLGELQSVFNKLFTFYTDLKGLRLFLYTNQYDDRLYYNNTRPTQALLDIANTLSDLVNNSLAELQEKRYDFMKYKIFYAHIPYTLTSLYHVIYRKPFDEKKAMQLLEINELYDVVGIKGPIKYIVYD